MLCSVPITKKGKTVALESSPKCKFKRILTSLCPVPQHFLSQFHISTGSSINMCGSPRAECHGIWWNFYRNVPQDFPKLTTLNNFCNFYSGQKQTKSFGDLNAHAPKNILCTLCVPGCTVKLWCLFTAQDVAFSGFQQTSSTWFWRPEHPPVLFALLGRT